MKRQNTKLLTTTALPPPRPPRGCPLGIRRFFLQNTNQLFILSATLAAPVPLTSNYQHLRSSQAEPWKTGALRFVLEKAPANPTSGSAGCLGSPPEEDRAGCWPCHLGISRSSSSPWKNHRLRLRRGLAGHPHCRPPRAGSNPQTARTPASPSWGQTAGPPPLRMPLSPGLGF